MHVAGITPPVPVKAISHILKFIADGVKTRLALNLALKRPLQQPPDRLRARRLRLRLAFDPSVELRVQLGRDLEAGEGRDAGAGAARRSFRFFGY